MVRSVTTIASLVALAAGCVGGGSADPDTALTVLYERAPHVSVLERLTLTCHPDGGNLPNPTAACRAIHADPGRFFGEVADVACIGPVIRWAVTISGHVDSRKVSQTYDMCDYPEARAWTDLGGTKLDGVVPATTGG
jgi:hypothetical protein